MKESYWGYWLVVLGIFVITVLLLIQNVTSQNTHDYYAVKEITEAAMLDAVDLSYMEEYGEVRISKEIFIESFLERFSQTASLNNTYKISFYDIYEVPPKVSVKVTSGSNSFRIIGDAEDFDIVNKIDAVVEVPKVIASYPGSTGKSECKDCIVVKTGVIEGTEKIKQGTTLPGSTTPGYDANNIWYDIVIDDNSDKKCVSVYGLFNNEDDNHNKVTSLSYDIYTCRLYDKNGNPKKSCDVVLPIYTVSGANVKGWKVSGGSTVYAIGETVTISKNTVFVPVFDTNALKAPSQPQVNNKKDYEEFKEKETTPTNTDTKSCTSEDISVANPKDGDFVNATAWPAANSINLYTNPVITKGKPSKIVKAGTPMRIHLCTGSMCYVWVRGDDCSKKYYVNTSDILVNLPDYVPSITYVPNSPIVTASMSENRRGIVENRKLDGDAPVVPVRYELATKLAEVESKLLSSNMKLAIYDLYIPVSALGNPDYKENVDCKFKTCNLTSHVLAGAVDATLYKRNGDSWEPAIMPSFDDPTMKKADGQQRNNQGTLTEIMKAAGINGSSDEWFHFSIKSADDKTRKINSNDQSKWGTEKTMSWGKKVWVYDTNKIAENYKQFDFAPYMFYEKGND